MNNWNSNSHSKYLLQYHLIFVCKYRKKLLSDRNISNDIKQFSYDICNKHDTSYLEISQAIFIKTFLERKYFLDGWIFCMFGR